MRNLTLMLAPALMLVFFDAQPVCAQAQVKTGSPHTRLRFFVSQYDVGEGSPVDDTTANEILAARISRLGSTFRFVTADEVRQVLDHEALKQMLGSDDDASALVQLGQTIQADRLLHGRMGKVGETYVSTLTLIDLSKGQVEKRVAGTFKGRADLAITRLNQQADEMLAYLLQTYAPDKVGTRRVSVDLGGGSQQIATPASYRPSILDLAGVGLLGLSAGLAAGTAAMHAAAGSSPPLWLPVTAYSAAGILAVAGGVLMLIPENNE